MKKSFFLGILAMLLISLDTAAQYENNIAVGLKIGEPLGINLRKYFQYGDKAFDVNFGTYGFIYGRERKYRKGNYEKSGLMFQGIYSWHRGLGNGDALKAYYGFGGQINYRSYLAELDSHGFRSVGVEQISIGPTGNAGIEYNLPGNDLGIFLDAGFYAELVPDLLFMHPQISAGVRVNIVRGK